ncbi:hypothetical protein GOV09_03725 [Candidatus Woesearchaeota archaeon]|nr:hypothetical protein [Candidatus Woesearchaeota archaeon]
MDISVLEELQLFEKSQESAFEQKKRVFLDILSQQKKELLDKNHMELFELSSYKHNLVKKAQEEAKKEASSLRQSYSEKIHQLDAVKNRINDAINIIFEEFLKNV